jgi:hypothetical protein
LKKIENKGSKIEIKKKWKPIFFKKENGVRAILLNFDLGYFQNFFLVLLVLKLRFSLKFYFVHFSVFEFERSN